MGQEADEYIFGDVLDFRDITNIKTNGFDHKAMLCKSVFLLPTIQYYGCNSQYEGE